MITRRQAVLLSLQIPLALTDIPAWSAQGSEFWNSKDPSQWSDDEVSRMLTDSPWAKEVPAEFDFTNASRGGGRGGMGGMGGGMGGRGGYGGRGGMGGGMGTPGGGVAGTDGQSGQARQGPRGGSRILIRWETAQSVRDAARKALDPDPAGDYVISASGLGFLGRRRRGAADDAVEDNSERRAAIQERLRDATELQRKGQPPLHPERVETSQDGTILFFFTRDYHPIQANDKDVTFVTKFGPLVAKVKFNLREMMYRGKLEL